jgi:hypothetical protein
MWTFDELRNLGHVAPQDMTRAMFLTRAATLFAPFEKVREKPLREIVRALGVANDDVREFGSIKLLGTIAQLATAAVESGLSLQSDAPALLMRWDRALRVPALRPLFALNQLRQLASHAPPSDAAKRLSEALKVFEIDIATVTGGWGRILDKVYDDAARGLQDLATLLHEARTRSS